ncbi:MAG: putative selenate reductase subunit YgfK [Spirochaetes bacterium GWD1_61_31]|nr:MAG: putative selenate reductase subunit YgfK [Spirochaetes bacterium GWD1_61_31]OHD44054.1 MAG: putative selenate reductase subunit YgfK [Spirochaetes bacterium GWE1_60_18]
MSKLMKALPMADLLRRICGEWAARQSIYDIPAELVRRVLDLEAASTGFAVNGLKVSLPVGPAAGPHSQIAPNLVAAWLAGSRVFELKTVQENDRLEIAKPCIDALDEGHNVEWSTELLLEEARAEYLRGWLAIHLLRAALAGKGSPASLSGQPGVLFNMSVGYTLDGIKGPKVDGFIEGMRNPSGTAIWETALAEARLSVGAASFAQAFGKAGQDQALAALAAMPANPIHSVTLSTMHGCPPEEIERIGAYLIDSKHFDTYIKLNPTLLGYDTVRGILDTCGWQKVRLTRPNFEHDLQFEAALRLVATLRAKAAAAGRHFGVKLSNTLANVNDEPRLPGAERYMSGRALFPITARLAADLAAALPQPPAFSYCGGVSAFNVYDCLQAGLGPLTVATDILKPGGYLRLEPMAREAVRALKAGLPGGPDKARLRQLAEAALSAKHYRGDWKRGSTAIAGPLPLTDCFAAPCVAACPAGQKPPAYMKALAKGEAARALSIILADNPLPHITGLLCDHQCMSVCARVDYEGPVEIRAMKLACARAASLPAAPAAPVNGKGKTAVFGAGPAGLACAHYLALHGYPVSLFDTALQAGGVPANVIPGFRIDPADIAKDVRRIEQLGARFAFGWSGTIDLPALKAEGYTSFVFAAGAPSPRPLELAGAGITTVDALDFLEAVHHDPAAWADRQAVVVCGGGNTAMDAARAAVRLSGRPSVSLLYRRTLAEMPADREEYEAALADGVAYRSLSLPESAAPAAGVELPRLTVREMQLGEPDQSGRRSPLPAAATRVQPCDLLIAAVGELPDRAALEALGVKVGPGGRPEVDPRTMASNVPGLYVAGDARRGPASIIAAAADGRQAAYAILELAGLPIQQPAMAPPPADREALSRRGELLESCALHDAAFVQTEAEQRCLSCGSACLRCVEVCPNRANFALPVTAGDGLTQSIQIVHVDDLCNECGNCGFFCPWEGQPYLHKPTLFALEADLRHSANAGFAFLYSAATVRPELLLRLSPGQEQPVLRAAWADWSEPVAARAWLGKLPVGTKPELEAGLAKATGLLALAREIDSKHAYLRPEVLS